MSETVRSDVEEFVYTLVHEITNRSRTELRPELDLQRDLRIDGDDLSMWFARDIERRFQIRPTAAEWRGVHTIADALSLVDRCLQQGRTSSRG